MRYAKLIDGAIQFAPRKLSVGGSVVYNHPPEMLAEDGYKPVQYTDPPETEPGYIAVPGWTETEEAIVQTWAIEPEPDEIDEARAYRIISGEEE